ncbi:MAG: hypothetical protein MJ229_06245 [bacterium]|nr:hypothetical protein [bacterium]
MMKFETGATRIKLQWFLDDNSNAYNHSMSQISSGNKYLDAKEAPVKYKQAQGFSNKVLLNKNLKNYIELGNDIMTQVESSETLISDGISKIYDLTLQASNETYTNDDLNGILKEIKSILSFIDSTADNATFQGRKLLDGTCNNLFIQMSDRSGDTFDISNCTLDCHTTALGIDIPEDFDITSWTKESKAEYLTKLKAASETMTHNITLCGANSMRLDNAAQMADSKAVCYSDAKSAIYDADIAESCAEMVSHQIAQQVSVSILNQANALVENAFRLLQPSR